MKTQVKVALVTTTAAVLLAVGVVVAVALSRKSEVVVAATDGKPQVVRPNSHVLDAGEKGAVTVVEFLDFECEACGAFYPLVEDARKQYAGKIRYVVRYFPLPGHVNSVNAAVAAEAAGQQGQFEQMYRRLFETQQQWAEAKESRPEVFRTLAAELGLDMTAYDRAIADRKTVDRVMQDVKEGTQLGVNSTPTFYIDGKRVVLQQRDDLERFIEQAVRGNR
ncbi:DsbA family protein [Microbacterium sp. MMO-10]|uniref:DsbA family protein n=1 Tax=Microbacterium sp. MMO-10 TaxID=3081272 RepID=UPI003015D52E